MYQLFNATSYHPAGTLLFPELGYVRRGMEAIVEKVVTYHRERPKFIPSQHLLVRLLNSLNVSLALEPEVYADKVTDTALNLAMHLKMTSTLYKGQVFRPGVFYGEHIPEVLVATIDPFLDTQSADSWRDWTPIRVLYQPRADLALSLLDGRTLSDEEGVAVVEINIPMLATQYRMWREQVSPKTSADPMTVEQFLASYPLPNMLRSHLEWANFNRLMAQFFGFAINEPHVRQPYYTTNYAPRLDDAMAKYLTILNDRNRWSFDTMLSNFPCLFAADFHDVLRLPDMAFTLQIQWAVALARLPLIAFLVQVNTQTQNQANRQYLNQIRRYLRQFDLNKALRHALPNDLYEGIRVVIDRGILPNV